MSKESEDKIIAVLAKRFILTFEIAKDLYIAYRLTGSCDEGVETVAKMYELSPEVVRAVFYSLDDLYQMAKEDEDLKKWWKTGEM
jgi:hypothetical protein